MKKKLNRKMLYSLITFGTIATTAAIATPIVIINSSEENKKINIRNKDLKDLISFKGENGNGKIIFDKKMEAKNFTLQLNDESKWLKDMWMNGDIVVFDIKPKKGFTLSAESTKKFAVKVSNLSSRFIKDMDISLPITQNIKDLIDKINAKINNTNTQTIKLSYTKGNGKNYVLIKNIDDGSHNFINLQIHLIDEKDVSANPIINVMIQEDGKISSFDLAGYGHEPDKMAKIKATLSQIHEDFKITPDQIREIRTNMKSVYYTELAIRNFTYDEFWHLFNLAKSPNDPTNTSPDIKKKIIKILVLEMKQKAINEDEAIINGLKTFINESNITLWPSVEEHKITIKFSYTTVKKYEKLINIFDFNYDA